MSVHLKLAPIGLFPPLHSEKNKEPIPLRNIGAGLIVKTTYTYKILYVPILLKKQRLIPNRDEPAAYIHSSMSPPYPVSTIHLKGASLLFSTSPTRSSPVPPLVLLRRTPLSLCQIRWEGRRQAVGDRQQRPPLPSSPQSLLQNFFRCFLNLWMILLLSMFIQSMMSI